MPTMSSTAARSLRATAARIEHRPLREALYRLAANGVEDTPALLSISQRMKGYGVSYIARFTVLFPRTRHTHMTWYKPSDG
jgi:hypothetical protein